MKHGGDNKTIVILFRVVSAQHQNMKWLVLITIAVAVCSAKVIKDPQEGYKDGDRYFFFPGDGDGILHLVDTQAPVDEDFIRDYTRNPANNGYWLFTRSNPNAAQVLVFGDTNSVVNSNFNGARNTVILAHGWNGKGGNTMNVLLTEAFLEDDDVNIIVLDWSRLATRNYVTAKNGVAAVGRGLGEFVNWLTSFGASHDRMHLVGFSLGGHLVGNAGRETGAQVRRITALDPAGPLWGSDRNRIVYSDGRYVEVIHTNTAMYGFSGVCGDADFYPNGGSSMPGCWLNTCSHSIVYEYMAASIRYNHLLANECETLRDATRNRCTGDLNPMGNSNLSKTRSGIFRVNTERRYPF